MYCQDETVTRFDATALVVAMFVVLFLPQGATIAFDVVAPVQQQWVSLAVQVSGWFLVYCLYCLTPVPAVPAVVLGHVYPSVVRRQ